MTTISHDKLKQFVIITSTCLFTLMMAASSLLMNPLTSFARSNQRNDAVTTPTTSTDAIIQSIQKAVGKAKENILATTDQATTAGGIKLAAGLALYLFTNDTATKSACTGGCAKNWPPLLITAGSALSQVSLGSHKLTTVNTVHGTQVACDGHLLYVYKDDVDDATHAVNGEGTKWKVIPA